MSRAYPVCDAKDSRQLAEFLAQEGQLLLPMLDLIGRAEAALARESFASRGLCPRASRGRV